MDTNLHRTVLLHEAVDALALTDTQNHVVVDATGGVGGHSEEILKRLGKTGTLIIIEKDPESLKLIKNRIGLPSNVRFVCDDFRRVAEIVHAQGFTQVHAVLADLGWNNEQFQTGGRGFSFLKDEPLMMTYGDSAHHAFTARDIVNDWKEETIADVLYGYADERYARRIARVICEVRERKPLETTSDLVAAVLQATPKKTHHGRTHPATKTFQALRIAVNDELDAVSLLIEESRKILAPHGRLAIITFHSIEDRIVKNRFRDLAKGEEGILITKKPIISSEEELRVNPRARSAKLRIFETYETQDYPHIQH